MTEVNRSNYTTLIPQIIQQIHTSSFISIDAEYTGIHPTHSAHSPTLFDTPSQRYEKLAAGFTQFSICQFGLTIFSRGREIDEKGLKINEYIAESFNFYIWPLAFGNYEELLSIPFQISSLNFLSTNGFDWNKYFKGGVPFLRIKSQKKAFKKWLEANPYFMSTLEHRDLGYFPTFIDRLNDEDVEEIVDRLTGFTKIFDALRSCEKPIVGHNVYLDLLLMISQFYKQKLPSKYQGYKDLVHTLFPDVYDTKQITFGIRRLGNQRNYTIPYFERNGLRFGLADTTLNTLYRNLIKIKPDVYTPKINLIGDTGTKYGQATGKQLCHEAGYDSLITGICFLQLTHIAARTQFKDFLIERKFPPTFTESLKYVEEWKNRINIVRANVPFMMLAGKDPDIPQKPNWIQVDIKSGAGQDGAGDEGDIKVILLQRYGDMDFENIDPNTLLIACSNWGVARDVWAFLQSKGYKVKGIEWENDRVTWLKNSSVVRGFIVTSLIVGLGYFVFTKKIF